MWGGAFDHRPHFFTNMLENFIRCAAYPVAISTLPKLKQIIKPRGAVSTGDLADLPSPKGVPS